MWAKYRSYLICAISVAWVFLSTAFQHPENKPGNLKIRIALVFNGHSLVLSSQEYITANGDTIFIDQFRAYLGNFRLLNASGTEVNLAPTYHLLDAEVDSSMFLTFSNVPPGIYSELNFTIGTDSVVNVAGALDGALDPVNGMYWAWNTGYINAKLNGRSPSCNTLHQGFEYHIGGYLSPYQSSRAVRLTTLTEIKNEEATGLVLQADLAEWFKNPVVVDVSKTNSIVFPDKQSMLIADNYSDMFSVVQIKAEK